jgi:molybdate transport system substrate-binding protein
VNVLAAVSLREVFTDLAAEFERGDPTTRVRIAFGPSDALATQIVEGAIADVFAPAHPRWLDLVARHRAIVDRALLGRNTLVIALADGLRGRVRTIDDLARPGLRLVVAARSVPAGEYADTVLSRTGDTGALDNVVSREIDVKGVIQKVLLGEADAGLAYRTDLASGPAARLDRIEIPEEFNVRAEYPIAVLTDGPSPGAARRFVAFVLGPGQARLRAAGFLPPC